MAYDYAYKLMALFNLPALIFLAIKNFKSFKQIFEMLSENERIEATSIRSGIGNIILHVKNPDVLKLVLELLPENRRLQAVSMDNYYGETV